MPISFPNNLSFLLLFLPKNGFYCTIADEPSTFHGVRRSGFIANGMQIKFHVKSILWRDRNENYWTVYGSDDHSLHLLFWFVHGLIIVVRISTMMPVDDILLFCSEQLAICMHFSKHHSTLHIQFWFWFSTICSDGGGHTFHVVHLLVRWLLSCLLVMMIEVIVLALCSDSDFSQSVSQSVVADDHPEQEYITRILHLHHQPARVRLGRVEVPTACSLRTVERDDAH